MSVLTQSLTSSQTTSFFTPKQNEIIDHTDGNAVVLAVAGSGKTTVMTHRAANLASFGAQQARILMVTFTKKATESMRYKLDSLMCPGVEIRTLHALCYHIVRTYSPKFQRMGNLITEAEEWRRVNWMREVLKNIGIKDLKPKDGLSAVDHCKTVGVHPNWIDQYPNLQKGIPEKTLRIYRAWCHQRLYGDRFDYGDLVLEAAYILCSNQAVREQIRAKYDHVMVDEYQDTDPSQELVLEALCGCPNPTIPMATSPAPSLMVIGDDDQSIYGFRHATPDLILGFPEKWSAKTFFMEENFRSCHRILEAANTLIVRNKVRSPKTLQPTKEDAGVVEIHTRPDEASFVANRIQALQKLGTKLPEIGILFRTNEQSGGFESALTELGIPYICDWQREGFYGIPEVKTLLAYLRVTADPSDFSSLEYLINRPTRFVKKDQLVSCFSHSKTVDDVLTLFGQKTPALSGRLTQLQNLLILMRKNTSKTTLELVDSLISGLNYKSWISEQAAASSRTFEDMGACVNQMRRDANAKPSLPKFLKHVDKMIENAKKPKTKEAVRLLTLHKAKGLEFEHVFFTGFSNRYVPHPKGNAEEELRLAFVGMTRAKKKLILTAKDDLSVFAAIIQEENKP